MTRPGTAVLVLYLVAATAYNAGTPLFEAPDEHLHYFFAQHLAYNGQLPVQPVEPDERGPWEQEGSQPPLYYLLAAPVIRAVGAPLAVQDLWINPQNTMGSPALEGNENRFVHSPAEEWPWRGWALAAHLVRGLSTLLGAMGIWCLAALGSHVFPRRPMLAAAAAGVVGLSPQYLATAASVTNDALMLALAPAALYWTLRVYRAPRAVRPMVILGVLAGLAPLAKLSGLAVTAFSAGTLLFAALVGRPPRPLAGDDPAAAELPPVAARAWRARRRMALLLSAALVAGAAAAGSGWWYIRNWRLYGDPTGIERMLPGATRRDFAWNRWLAELPAELVGLWQSLWGVFGWFTVLMPPAMYRLLDAFVLVALIGAALAALGRAGGPSGATADRPAAARDRGVGTTPSGARAGWLEWRVVAWLAAWALVVFVSLLRWMTIAKGAHGRLLLPAGAVLGVVAVAGWRALVPARVSDGRLAAAVVGFMAAMSAIALAAVIRPVFAPLLPVRAPTAADGAVPAGATPAEVVFDSALELRWVAVPERVEAGAAMDVESAWRRLSYTPRDGLIALRIDPLTGGLPPGIARLSYLGRGTTPPALLQLDATYVDRATVIVPELVRADGEAAGDEPRAAGAMQSSGSRRRAAADSNAWPAMPVAARLSVHVWDPVAHDRWPLDDVGAAADEWAATVVVVPETPAALPAGPGSALAARFANGLNLHGAASTTERGPLEVWWHVVRDQEVELSALVHVVRGGEVAGVFDRPPATHATLPTHLWRKGDVIVARYPYEATSGDVILLGLYDAGGARVGVATAAGEPWADDVVRFEVQP